MDFSKQYDLVNNSVVRIISLISDGGKPKAVGSGSGILIGDGSYILTCSHCIIQGTQTVIYLEGDEHGHVPDVIFDDTDLDITLLKTRVIIGKGAKLKNLEDVKIGSECFVLGYPAYSNTITALGANIAGYEWKNKIFSLKIDASVNHGNSGGPLFDAAGNLIGIVNAKAGKIDTLLKQFQDSNTNNIVMQMNGMDHIKVLKTLVNQMYKNLNLGIGTAISIAQIAKLHMEVSVLMSQ
ncbi:serine protease [Flavobacterium sp. NRK1]|uniref:S1 family peptidase n=1 Tax=Flavobacterium sp. NRK1 TaxID=2954929 RepID=UPI0020930481|nr:serine protease [Flavobacterium sp. NRK1]MCO6148963.1 serine protease [Flavobacterium sp. NRK1]